jgi:hypothetical protein
VPAGTTQRLNVCCVLCAVCCATVRLTCSPARNPEVALGAPFGPVMQRPGTDPENVQMSDILCDFCRREWTEELPLVEGHQGSVICGFCLTEAYRALILKKAGTAPEGYKCILCLENRPDPGWRSPEHPEAAACARCVRQCAGVLSKDTDLKWTKPAS